MFTLSEDILNNYEKFVPTNKKTEKIATRCLQIIYIYIYILVPILYCQNKLCMKYFQMLHNVYYTNHYINSKYIHIKLN